MKLTELKIGKRARISEILAEDLSGKLKEFGIFSGAPVKILRTAPAGCPIIIESGGMQIGLRKEDAACVNIQQFEQE